MISVAGLRGLDSRLFCFLPGWPRACPLVPVGISVLICPMGEKKYYLHHKAIERIKLRIAGDLLGIE